MTNDVITKNNGKINHSKGIDESYPKMCFLLNFGSFYDTRSPNMVMSGDPRCKFQKFLFFLNSTFNIRKSYKMYSGKLFTLEVISKNPHGGVENPSAFRVNEASEKRLKEDFSPRDKNRSCEKNV